MWISLRIARQFKPPMHSLRQGLVVAARSRTGNTALRSEFSTLNQWRGKVKTPKPEEKPTEEKPTEEKPTEETTKSEESSKGEESASSPNEEGKEQEKKDNEKDKEDPPPPPPHGDKSPLTVFYETLQSEFKKSQEWQESTKQLADSAHQFSESPAVRRAREAYGTTAQVAEKVGGKAAETLGRTASAVGKGAAWTWETPVVKAGRTAVRKTSEGIAEVTKPVRETKVYKDVVGNVKEVIDDGSSSRYGGYLEREERKRQRELRERRGDIKKLEKHEEDPKYARTFLSESCGC
jgi:mitochondrial import inner membrane translocase subunit TIM44